MKEIFRLSRFTLWWNHLIGPIMIGLYTVLFIAEISLMNLGFYAFWFFMSVCAAASLGYFCNDWFDQAEDAKVGKANLASYFSFGQGFLVGLILLMGSFGPWYYLPKYWFTIGLLILLFVIILLYSAPPFRFKNRSVLGVISDALYGHLLPFLITVFTFATLSEISHPIPYYLIGLLLVFLFTKGLRNIIIHQVNDRKNDKKNQVNTLVLHKGPLWSVNLVNKVLLPLEIALVFIVSNVLIVDYHWLFVWIPTSFLGFHLFTYFKFKAWKKPFLPINEWRFKFWYFLNDYYEEWLPLIGLFILILKKPFFWPLLPLHFLLFYPSIKKIINDFSQFLIKKDKHVRN